MQTYTTRRNLFGDLCNNSAEATLSLADKLMNACEKRIISSRDWDFLWRQYTKLTVAGEQSIKLPPYTHKPQSLYITVGGTRYNPKEVTNREDWDRLNEVSVTSDSCTHYFVYDGEVELYPIPATSNNVVTFNCRRKARDLTIADYVTPTSYEISEISTTGITTTLTIAEGAFANHNGFHIRIDPFTSVNVTAGDGHWYEIADTPTSTTHTLVKTYGGEEVTGASLTYTIAELSLIPEPHDMLPIYEALKIYYSSVDPDKTKSELYAKMYIEGYDQMIKDHGSKVNVVLDDGEGRELDNPNFYITI